jgi:hypothetical protein
MALSLSLRRPVPRSAERCLDAIAQNYLYLGIPRRGPGWWYIPLAAINGERLVPRNSLIDTDGHLVQSSPQLLQVGIALDRQSECGVMLLPLSRPGIPWDEVFLEIRPTKPGGQGRYAVLTTKLKVAVCVRRRRSGVQHQARVEDAIGGATDFACQVRWVAGLRAERHADRPLEEGVEI